MKDVNVLNSSDEDAGAELLREAAQVEMTVPELLAFAMRLHRDHRLDAAEKCYRGVLEADVGNATATHYLGVLLRQRGKGAEGLGLIQQSILIDSGVASWHNNLGNVFLEEGRFDDAAAAYARCSASDSINLEVLNNLGVLLRRLNRKPEAEESLKKAISLDPSFGDAHTNLATLYTTMGRMTEAFSHFADALALRPADVNTRRLLVIALGKAGRLEEGRKHCLEWLKLEPNDPKAKHFLAAYGGAEVPDRASNQFVAAEFDGFANSFDAKLAALEYRAPELVGEVVADLLGEKEKIWRILDAGCGTGLCGPFLHPYAKELVGVDLSANMLSRAADRNLYDDLIQCELVEYMVNCESAFDVVVSADTLCYFGNLSHAFSAAKKVLRQDGQWVFTVEAHANSTGFSLQTHGRYSHSRAYIEAELDRAGFATVNLKSVELRHESGDPVTGWLVSAS